MTKLMALAVSSLALFSPISLRAAEDGNPKAAAEEAAIKAGSRAVGFCSICVTCGDRWPVFAGSWDVPFTNRNVTERGKRCSGVLEERTDSRPFLCCQQK